LERRSPTAVVDRRSTLQYMARPHHCLISVARTDGCDSGSTTMIRDQVRYPAMRISMAWCPGVNRKVEGVFPTKLPSITISAPSGVLPNATDDGATPSSVAASDDGGAGAAGAATGALG